MFPRRACWPESIKSSVHVVEPHSDTEVSLQHYMAEASLTVIATKQPRYALRLLCPPHSSCFCAATNTKGYNRSESSPCLLVLGFRVSLQSHMHTYDHEHDLDQSVCTPASLCTLGKDVLHLHLAVCNKHDVLHSMLPRLMFIFKGRLLCASSHINCFIFGTTKIAHSFFH